MIIKKLELVGDEVLVDIEGRDNITLAFGLQTIPNPDRLIQLIKAKIADIDSGPGTPPVTDWAPFVTILKQALEGTDMGD